MGQLGERVGGQWGDEEDVRPPDQVDGARPENAEKLIK